MSNKRNLALMGHAQTGKTSLCEALLFKTKTTSRLGSVAEGNTVSDYSDDEIERKSSVNASFCFCNYKNINIRIIDTPGYADFIGETLSVVRAIDFGVIVVDPVSGVDVGTETAWDLLEQNNLPRLFFINKLDKENADFINVVKSIQDSFGKKCAPLAYSQGQAASFRGVVSLLDIAAINGLASEKEEALRLRSSLIEAIAEAEDSLLEKYLDKGELSVEEMAVGLSKGISSRRICPVLCGSVLKDKGVDLLLDIVAQYCPAPEERGSIKGKDPKTQEEKIREIKSDKPFSAFVFKTFSDPYVGQLNLLRIFSGSLNSNTGFYNVSKSSKERIGQLFILQGKEQKAIEKAETGDIVAVAKLKDTVTCDSLSDEKDQILFEPIVFPEPLISLSVKPKSRADEEKISQALARTSYEDPTFTSHRDSQTKELIVSGIGDLHLNLMINRMRKRFGVEVELGTPKVPYKETITKKVRVQGKYKKQSGGRGQYGDCTIEIEPLERGKDFEFVDKIFGGAIPRNFIPSVEKGIRNAAVGGAVAGYPIVDIRVTLLDGSYHDVDSSDMAFQIAGAMALRKAIHEAGPALIEPVMDVEVVVPDEYMGTITGDLNGRRGRIMGMDVRGKNEVVKAQVPLSEMFTYANELRSITQGRGYYTMKFSHYDQVPHKIAQPIIDHYAKNKKPDEHE